MTNHWIDVKNSDCILVMGANPAENHPCSIKWVVEAMEKGATLISVDPRYTRTSVLADIYARLRSGSDIAFLGGMIKYILEADLIHRDYVVHYTNAAFLIEGEFDFDQVTGLFTGYDEQGHSYDRKTWQYQIGADGEPVKDPSLQHPQCVYQQMKKHYGRYSLETVSSVTGTPVEDLRRVYAAFSATGASDKVGTVMYAMGWTQHTAGTQNIRAMAIIQLLLGNVGRAGGGVNALRGESNVQGSTDHALLFHILPGYLKTPRASLPTLAAYNERHTPKPIGKRSANWWANYPKYAVSFLKSMYGEAATKQNDFAYSWLPKLDDDADYSWLTLFDQMHAGAIRGFFVWGQNPACSGANARKVRESLAKLDWLVNVNLFPNETGWFWQETNLGLAPEDIQTEVFVLPAAVSVEKEGSITNSGRWMQWRYAAAERPGEARPDAAIMDLIQRELKKLYAAEGGAFPDPIQNLAWDYVHDGEVDPHAVARAINGSFVEDVEFPSSGRRFKKGDLVPSFAYLKEDGSTACGNWLYCASYTEEGNMAARRTREAEGIGLHPEWGWCWPVNRRILYNRASVDLDGRPWDAERPVIAWQDGRWVGDVPDGGWPPMSVDPAKTRYPFIMKPEGHARLFAMELADGPLPEHYEPLESPLSHNPFNRQMLNPVVKPRRGVPQARAAGGDPGFPYVCSTYRVSEHWQTGVMTRHMPWLLELQPQLFIELSHELAREKGIEPGALVRVSSQRGAVTAVALPTARMKPMLVEGRRVHQVGLPWCFGWIMPRGGLCGESANLLTPDVGDANTMIPETKAFMVNIERAEV